MNIRSNLLVAASLAAGIVGLQSNSAAAMTRVYVDSAVSAPAEGARIDKVRWCNRYGCYRGHRYAYRYYGYGYPAYYRPYGYGVVLPGVRIGY